MSSLASLNNLSHVSDEFINDFPTDVTFFVGPTNVEVKGHKAILANGSVVICNTLKSRSEVFSFPNFNADAFKLMMVYIYKRHLTLVIKSEVEAARLLEVATHFKIPELIDKSISKLEIQLSNVQCMTEVFTEALTLKLPQLTNFVLDCICQKGKDVIESEAFLKLSLEAINLIISNDNLQVPNEISVYEAAVRWAEHKLVQKGKQITGQEIREELGQALHSIRFPLIPMAEFLPEIQLNKSKEGILRAEEISEIHTYHSSNQVQLDDEQRSRLTTLFSKTLRKHVNVLPILDRNLFISDEQVSYSKADSDNEPPRKMPRIENVEVESKEHENSNINNSEQSENEVEIIPFTPLQMPYSHSPITLSSDEEESSNEKETNISESDSDNESEIGPNSTISQEEKEYCKMHSSRSFTKLYEECELLSKEDPSCGIIDRDELHIIQSKGAYDQFEALYFPNLKTFKVKYLLNAKNPDKFTNELKKISASHLLYFKTNRTKVSDSFLESRSELQNAEVQINGVTVLKIDKENRSFTNSRIYSHGILEELKDLKWHHIHLESVNLSSLNVLPTVQVKSLTLRNVTLEEFLELEIQDPSYGDFLASCPKLEEFSCDNFGYKGQKYTRFMDSSLIFSELTETSKLRKLSVGNAYLDFFPIKNNNISLPNLEELYVSNSNWNPRFEAIVPYLFPNLKKVQIRTSVCQVKLVAQLLKIDSLVWLSFWKMSLWERPYTFNGSKVTPPQQTPAYLEAAKLIRKVLTDAGLQDNGSKNVPKTALLERTSYNEPWIKSNLRINGTDQLGIWDFEHSNWNQFYKDYQHYKQINGPVSI